MGELSERALKWLAAFVASRNSAHAASLELGHQGNWAGRLLDPEGGYPCNWSFREIETMAAHLGMGAIQLDEAIRACIVPAGKPKMKKPRAKPRRAPKRESVQPRTNRT
jgi:hypothetical protein